MCTVVLNSTILLTMNSLKEAIERLDQLFSTAFDTNHPACHDWALVRMELKYRPKNEVKSAPDPRHKQFIEWWTKRYREVFGREYVVNGAKDGSNLSRFLKSLKDTTVSEMSEMVEAAWCRAGQSKDSFFCRKATTITGFVTSWNDICAELERGLSPARREGGGF